MNIITLEEEAFYALVKQVVEQMKAQQGFKKKDKWISGDEVMALLRIKSKTTLQKLRDEGKIRFSQPEQKIILYDIDSVDAYLEKHAKNPF